MTRKECVLRGLIDGKGLGNGKVNLYYWDPQNGGHPSGPAHVTNPNLSRPGLMVHTCQGHLTLTNHHCPSQLYLAYLTLENKAC